MKVKLPTDQPEKQEEVLDVENHGQDELPPELTDETPEEKPELPEKQETKSDLELKIARLEGQVDILRSSTPKAPAGPTQEDRDAAAKVQCQADMNSLDDDSFSQKYRMTKLQANTIINDHERNKEKVSNSIRIAELEAKNDLLAKYPSISKHFEKIKQSVKSELSVEAQQDPERLRRAMEREFLIFQKENPEPEKKKAEDPMRRRIVTDFEKPNPDGDRKRDKENRDELAPELVEVGKRFGITSESQRKKFSNPYIPMNLGGGVKFEDPRRGFERDGNK